MGVGGRSPPPKKGFTNFKCPVELDPSLKTFILIFESIEHPLFLFYLLDP